MLPAAMSPSPASSVSNSLSRDTKRGKAAAFAQDEKR
jgi:hypothetical protein